MIGLLFTILFFLGWVAVGVFLTDLNLKARRMLELNEGMKRQALGWIAAGSVWCALTLASAAFFMDPMSSEPRLSVSGLALAVLGGALVGGGLLVGSGCVYVFWLDRMVLPALRRKRELDDVQKDEEMR